MEKLKRWLAIQDISDDDYEIVLKETNQSLVNFLYSMYFSDYDMLIFNFFENLGYRYTHIGFKFKIFHQEVLIKEGDCELGRQVWEKIFKHIEECQE